MKSHDLKVEEGECEKENQGTFGTEGRLDSEATRTRVQLSTLSRGVGTSLIQKWRISGAAAEAGFEAKPG